MVNDVGEKKKMMMMMTTLLLRDSWVGISTSIPGIPFSSTTRRCRLQKVNLE